jgi:cytochrome c biogenesis protein CcmG, thiol:disulfide interchange protein DsbE
VNRKVLIVGCAVTLPLIALLLLGLGRDPKQIDSPLIGQRAPTFRLAPVGGGEPVALESLRGKVVVLNFWATWCVPCYQEHPVLVEAARRTNGDPVFVGIVYDDDEARVKAFLAKQGSGYRSLMDDDGKTAIAYGVYGVPESFFLSPDGKISSKYVGPLTPQLLDGFVQKARGGGL